MAEALRDASLWLRLATRRWTGRDAGRRADQRPAILVIDEMLPEPRFGAGYPRAARLLAAIVAAGWEATVYPMIATRQDTARMRLRYPEHVHFVDSFGQGGLRRLLVESSGAFALILVSRPTVMEAFMACAEATGAWDHNYVLYDAEALFALRDARRTALFGEPMTEQQFNEAMRREMALLAKARAIVAVTQAEAEHFREHTRSTVHVVAHGIDAPAQMKPLQERRDLLFVGRSSGPRDHSPNVDSLIWFVDDVMPLLDRQAGTGYRLLIAGIADASLIQRLSSERVVFLGIVDDLSALYDQCRVFVAPTRFAAGLPLKVIEAMAAGVPCVVTTLLAEQLAADDGVELLAAADAEAFSSGCRRLLTDDALWLGIRQAAFQRVQAEYSSTAFDRAVSRLLTDCLYDSRS